MAAKRTLESRQKFFSRVRKQRLKYISILPSLVTLLNAIFGFAAIGFASKGTLSGSGRFFFHQELTYFALSGYMVFLAMIADVLDGRLARMNKSTSSFGGQLDSLCDMVSFGVAPAFLMLKVLEGKLSDFADVNPAVAGLVVRFIWLSAAVFVGCAAIRLARFNVENEEDESSHMNFWGLPSPAAAGVICSLVVFHQDLLPKLTLETTSVHHIIENIILYALPFAAVAIALLMISRIRYPHLVNKFVRGKKPFAYLIWGLLLLVLVIWNHQLIAVLAFCGFAFSGFIRWAYQALRGKKNIFEMQQNLLFDAANQQPASNEND